MWFLVQILVTGMHFPQTIYNNITRYGWNPLLLRMREILHNKSLQHWILKVTRQTASHTVNELQYME